MPWLKKHYDRVLLLVSALLLIAVCAFLFLRAQSFATDHGYEPIDLIVEGTAPRDNKITPLPEDAVQKVATAVEKPSAWTKGDLRLFSAEVKLLKTVGSTSEIIVPESGMLHPPVPNEWLNKFELTLTDADILSQDPDRDGFSNLDEWKGVDPAVPDSVLDRQSTDPKKADSHPPYYTKLYLKQAVSVPLPIVFSSVPSPDTFIINTHPESPSQFLSVGDVIVEERPNQPTRKRFKIKSFEKKTAMHPELKFEIDASEITLENMETNQTVVLPVGKTLDSPDSYAKFIYAWDNNAEITVKKGLEFSLKPDETVYKLIEISDDKAVITDVKGGKNLEIRKRPQS